jgi:hypothetical protein
MRTSGARYAGRLSTRSARERLSVRPRVNLGLDWMNLGPSAQAEVCVSRYRTDADGRLVALVEHGRELSRAELDACDTRYLSAGLCTRSLRRARVRRRARRACRARAAGNYRKGDVLIMYHDSYDADALQARLSAGVTGRRRCGARCVRAWVAAGL